MTRKPYFSPADIASFRQSAMLGNVRRNFQTVTAPGGRGTPTTPTTVTFDRYTVTTGDSTSTIARKLGVTVTDLLDANPRKKRTRLDTGVVVFGQLLPGELLNVPGTEQRARSATRGGVGVGAPMGPKFKAQQQCIAFLSPNETVQQYANRIAGGRIELVAVRQLVLGGKLQIGMVENLARKARKEATGSERGWGAVTAGQMFTAVNHQPPPAGMPIVTCAPDARAMASMVSGVEDEPGTLGAPMAPKFKSQQQCVSFLSPNETVQQYANRIAGGDIQKVGERIFTYGAKGTSTLQIGLLAQNVRRVATGSPRGWGAVTARAMFEAAAHQPVPPGMPLGSCALAERASLDWYGTVHGVDDEPAVLGDPCNPLDDDADWAVCAEQVNGGTGSFGNGGSSGGGDSSGGGATNSVPGYSDSCPDGTVDVGLIFQDCQPVTGGGGDVGPGQMTPGDNVPFDPSTLPPSVQKGIEDCAAKGQIYDAAQDKCFAESAAKCPAGTRWDLATYSCQKNPTKPLTGGGGGGGGGTTKPGPGGGGGGGTTPPATNALTGPSSMLKTVGIVLGVAAAAVAVGGVAYYATKPKTPPGKKPGASTAESKTA